MQAATMKWGVCLLLAVYLSSEAEGLKLTQLLVPTQVDLREEVTLSCEFDLGGKGLYSIKWYKDEFEFYRYMPDNRPPDQSFPVPGINLDLQRSNMTTVRLKQLSFNTSGTYRCEVSTEGPNFQTVIDKGNMTVMALPQHDPMIEGIMTEYAPGDYVSGNCTSAKSNPPSILAWYINNVKVDSWLLQYYPTSVDYVESIGLHTRSLGLRFQVEKRHFAGSGHSMELRCTATIDDRKWTRSVSPALSTRLSNQKLAQERLRNAAVPVTSSVNLMLFLVTSLAAAISS